MFGQIDQQPGHAIIVTARGDGYRVQMQDGAGDHDLDLPSVQLYAGMSFLEGHVLNGGLRRVKSLGDELEHRVMAGTHQSAVRKILNGWDGDKNPWPWAGVGVIPASPDGQEFAFARKDEKHPRHGYALRLSLIGGGMDPNEILSDWGEEPDVARVAMLRECFEEIRVVEIARQIAEAAKYHGPARATCYLYEHSGERTEGVIRAFVARAPSADAWDHWRKIFTREVDGLSEAQPVLLTRQELVEAIKQDVEAAKQREAYLTITSKKKLAEIEQGYEERFSRRKVSSDTEWLRRRTNALADGVFPLMHRGNFAFISGHSGPVHHVLSAEGIL